MSRQHLQIMRALLAARHQASEGDDAEVSRLFDGLFEGRQKHHVFAARELAVTLNDEPLEAPVELAAAFALMLRHRGLESVAMHPSIPPDEVALLTHLLRTGERPDQHHPHLRLFAAEEAAPEAADALGAALFARLDVERAPGTDAILAEYLGRPEWLELAPHDVPRALDATMALLAGGGDGLFEKTPAELVALGGTAPVVRAAATADAGPAAVASRAAVAEPTDTVGAEIEAHDDHHNALLVLCQLLLSSTDPEEYRRRRRVLEGAFAQGSYSSLAVADILRFLAVDLPPLRFDGRGKLLTSVFDHIHDEEAIVLFLGTMSERANVIRPLLNRFVVRQNPFPLLVRLLNEDRLHSFHRLLTDRLLEAARAKPEALRLWAREHRGAFFSTAVFTPLFARGTEIIGAICKEILSDGPEGDRNRLIELLREDGSETALRLLVLGMTYGREPCAADLLEALSHFQHPLAVATLREVVHRSNTGPLRLDEAQVALSGIERTRTEEGALFLREVVEKRSGFLPMYRKPLRRLAARILEKEGPA